MSWERQEWYCTGCGARIDAPIGVTPDAGSGCPANSFTGAHSWCKV
ncbi:hypothetical protein [uncultured Draconibacterium sp.]|nr:hypothetical protein [uncultured Draconibacterium sp.]